MFFIAYALTIILVGLMIYSGYRDGLFSALLILSRHLVAFLVAMTFYEPVGRLLSSVFTNAHPWPLYFRVLSLAGLYGLVGAGSMWAKMKYTIPRVEGFRLLDRIGGCVCGAAGGLVITGFVLILWTNMPFAKYLPQNIGQMNSSRMVVDSGSIMLRFYGFVAAKMRVPGGRPFLLEDEPLTIDVNGDREYQQAQGDEFSDINKNGRRDRGALWHYRNYADFTYEDILKMQGSPGGNAAAGNATDTERGSVADRQRPVLGAGARAG